MYEPGLNNHGGRNEQKKGLCVRGKTCSEMHTTCPYNHNTVNKPCRYGSNCPNSRTTCLFIHNSADNMASSDDNRRGQFNNTNNDESLSRSKNESRRTILNHTYPLMTNRGTV